MTLSGGRAWRVDFDLKEPYQIAYASYTRAPVVFLEIRAENGECGYGAGAPDPDVTGETPERTLEALSAIAPRLAGRPPWDRYYTLEWARAEFPGAPAAWAALDIALHDLAARGRREPLYRMFGAAPRPLATFITIGALPLEPTLEAARRRMEEGFRAIKLKGGLNLEEDIARARRLREVAGGGLALAFDANQGYDYPAALRFARETRAARLEFIEQPTPAAEPALLARLGRESGVAVMADESLVAPADLDALTREPGLALVNLKLMKHGGLTPTRLLAREAARRGLRLMLGCMDESALSVAAAAHLLCLLHMIPGPPPPLADLDGHLDLTGDPFAGCLSLRSGALHLPSLPGLGYPSPLDP